MIVGRMEAGMEAKEVIQVLSPWCGQSRSALQSRIRNLCELIKDNGPESSVPEWAA